MAKNLRDLGDAEQAGTYLSKAYAIAHGMKSGFLEFVCLCNSVHLALDASRDQEAISLLRQAMTLGSKHGFAGEWFWQRPSTLIRLCVKALENNIEVEYALDDNGHQSDTERLVLYFEKGAALYKGNFLHDDTEQPWAASVQEHMRSRFLNLLGSAASHYETLKLWEKAAAWYRKGLQVDNLAEEFYQGLMVCKQHLGQTAKAVKTYQRCCAALSAGLDLPPSPRTEEIYAGLVKKR